MQLNNQRDIQEKKPLKLNFDPVYQSATAYNYTPQAKLNTHIQNDKRKKILTHGLGLLTCFGIVFHFASIQHKPHRYQESTDIVNNSRLNIDTIIKTPNLTYLINNPLIKEISEHSFFNLKNESVIDSVVIPFQLHENNSLNSKNKTLPKIEKQQVNKPINNISYTPKMSVLTNYIAEGYNIPKGKANIIVKEAFSISDKKNIDPLMLLAITAVESEFNDKARNPSGAVGLVQALPKAHPEKVRVIKQKGGSLYNIHNNLSLGAQIYKEYLTASKGNPTQALQRYNGSLSDKKKVYSKKVFKELKSMKKIVATNNKPH